MAIVALNKPFLWLKLLQFLLGLVCYSLFFAYDWNLNGESSGTAIVKHTLQVVAVVGFPFVILPVIVATSFLEGERLESHLLVALLSFCGFVTSLIAGSLEVQNVTSGQKATGAICIIYSMIFLVDVAWYGFMRFKGRE